VPTTTRAAVPLPRISPSTYLCGLLLLAAALLLLLLLLGSPAPRRTAAMLSDSMTLQHTRCIGRARGRAPEVCGWSVDPGRPAAPWCACIASCCPEKVRAGFWAVCTRVST
jgi:hypothetical protein